MALGLAAAVSAVGLFTAEAQEKKEIKGAITGKVKSVDPDKGTLTITTAEGRTRTFTVNESTTMAGPRGGQVPRRLKDPRFHEGLEVTIEASGDVAKEVRLGYDRKPAEDKPVKAPAKAPADTKVREQPKKAADEEITGKVKERGRGK